MIEVSTTMKEKDYLPLLLAKAKFINDVRSSLESLQEKVISENTLKEIKSKFYSKLNEYRMQVHKENLPFYKHDCSECVWLGDFFDCRFESNNILIANYFDLYVYDYNDRITLIARYGDNDPDYTSFTLWKTDPCSHVIYKNKDVLKYPGIREAYKRFKKSEKGKKYLWKNHLK